jgi:hypothetical protein
MRKEAFGHGSEQPTKLEWDGEKNWFGVGQPDPGKSCENHIGRIFDPRGAKAKDAGNFKSEIAQSCGGSTKIESLADGLGLAKGSDYGVGDR